MGTVHQSTHNSCHEQAKTIIPSTFHAPAPVPSAHQKSSWHPQSFRRYRILHSQPHHHWTPTPSSVKVWIPLPFLAPLLNQISYHYHFFTMPSPITLLPPTKNSTPISSWLQRKPHRHPPRPCSSCSTRNQTNGTKV